MSFMDHQLYSYYLLTNIQYQTNFILLLLVTFEFLTEKVIFLSTIFKFFLKLSCM